MHEVHHTEIRRNSILSGGFSSLPHSLQNSPRTHTLPLSGALRRGLHHRGLFLCRPGPGASKTPPDAQKLNTRHFPADNLLEVIASELDKVFYGVEYVQTETADMPLADYLYYKAKETDCKYRFLILVGEGGQCPNGLPMKLHTRLKNKLHRSIYLELDYYDDDKEGRGVVKQCYYYDRQYRKRMTAVSPPTLVSCFFPYTREGILTLVNQELCCDFTHILVTEGIDLDSNTTPLCGAI